MTDAEFRKTLERFLKETGMSATALGLDALRDPAFVWKIRKGRKTGPERQQRVLAFMAAHRAKGRAA